MSFLDEAKRYNVINWVISERIKKINRAELLQPFFVIIPHLTRQEVLGEIKTETYGSSSKDVLLWQFDNYLKHLLIFDTNGFVIKRILLTDMKLES